MSLNETSLVQRLIKVSDNTNLGLYTKPVTAKIEATGLCTMNCRFCYHAIMRKNNIRQKFLNKTDFHIIVNNLLSMNSIKEVGMFYMGESGLHEELPYFYRKLKEYEFFTYLTTNATFIRHIMKSIPYIDSLKVSWNYKNENDFLRKTSTKDPRVYKEIIDNIFTLKRECERYNKRLTISTILDDNKKYYREALSVFNGIEHYWLPLQTQGGHIKGNGGVNGELDHMVKSIPCWSLFKGVYVDVDMNVRCCCYGHQKDHILGNLKCNKLSDILQNEKLRNMKLMHLHSVIPPLCKDCLGESM